MTASKSKAEVIALIVCSIFTVIGTCMCFSALFVPYWYERKYEIGIIHVKANLGLWLDRICQGVAYQEDDCTDKWITDDDYERPEPLGHIPYGTMIRWFETVAVIMAMLATVFLVTVWCSRNSTPCKKNPANVMYFATTMIAGFAAVVGTLILASKGEKDDADWAPFLSGIGGALLFISGCMNCVIFRWDPTFGTLENPVSPKYYAS